MKIFPAVNASNNPSSHRTVFSGRHRLVKLTLAALTLGAMSTASFALKNTDPGDPPDPGPLPVNVSGALIFRGCEPSSNDVTVRIDQPAKTGHPSTPVRLSDGSLRMTYSVTLGTDADTLPAQVVVRPQVNAGVCGAGSFSPASRTVIPGAAGVNFDYQVAPTGNFTIPLDTFVLLANSFLSTVRLHLNNDRAQNSFVTLGNNTTAFNITPENVDLPFPFPGSASFFVRDMNLTSAKLSRSASTIGLKLRFEENGIEVKGYHSTLGDVGMPDFQMRNIALNLTAGLRVKNAKLVLGFSSPHLDASVTSTGACNILGLDWCNVLFGTSGRLKQSFERTAFAQLNGSNIQSVLSDKLMEGLAQFGITGRIGSVKVQGDFIIITTI